MKLKAYIKVTLIGLVRDFPMMVFCFAVFPILLSMLYGYFQHELFKPSNKMSSISVSIQNNDKSSAAKGLEEFLKSDYIKEFISVEQDDAELTLIIPKGYEQGLTENKAARLTIKHQDEKNDQKAAIVSAVLKQYNERLQEQMNLQKKAGFDNQLAAMLFSIEGSPAVKNEILPQQNSLSSYEYYSASIFSFLFVIVTLALVAGFYKEKETGIFNRIISASLSKYQYFNYSLVSYFIVAMLINIVYVSAFRLLGLSFGGSLGLLFLIILGNSIMEAVVAGVVIVFFRSKLVATMCLNVLIMLTATLGGAFAPIDKLASGIFLQFAQLLPNTLIINTFKNYLLYDSFAAISSQLMMFAVASVLLYIVGITKIFIKWEA